MEKLPLGERPEPRTVGRGSFEAKAKTKREIIERFQDNLVSFTEEHIAELKAAERDKTDEQKEGIKVANEITNEILREFGLQEFDIPEQNVHFVSAEEWAKHPSVADVAMSTFPEKQLILAKGDYQPSARVSKALSLFHEMIHAKGHFSIDVDSDVKHGPYRSGLTTHATYKKVEKSGNAVWFDGLNEAVVAQIEMDYGNRVLTSNPFLKDQVEYLSSNEVQKMKHDHAKKRGIDPSEIEWIGRDGDDIEVFYASYPGQRRVLNYVVDQICADGDFASRDDVMKLFFAAHFRDSLLPLGRIVEKSFGKGSFEFLGTMDRESDSGSVGRVLDFLTKRRREMKKT